MNRSLPKILVSIVLYRNALDQIERAIQSALSTPGNELEIKVCLIDNSPSDALRVLSSLDSRVEYRFQNANLGYGAGHNRAIQEFAGWSDYHLVLNPDIQFGAEVLPALAQFMEQTPTAGLCMPRILYPDGSFQKACRLLPTPANLILRRFPFSKTLLAKSDELYEMAKANFQQKLQVPFLSGCFMFFRTSVLVRLRGFDERFFMYLEDTDLSRRAYEMAENYYIPEVSVVHEHQKGSHKSWRLLKFHMMSAIKYFNKWGWFFDQRRKRINCDATQRYLDPV